MIYLIGVCPLCSSKVEVEINHASKKGFAQLLMLKCVVCPWETSFYSSNKIMRTDKMGPKNFEVNTRIILAFREIGKGLNAMETFAMCMNMTNCMAQKSYDSVNKSLQRSYTEVAQVSQKKAAKEMRENLATTGLFLPKWNCYAHVK